MDNITGFNNTGVICWFNSLLQSLLSSKYFVDIVLNEDPKENLIINELQKIIRLIKGRQSDPIDSINVLKAFLIVLQRKDRNRYIEFANGQQSASEGMTLLLDCIGSKKLDLAFTHKYEEKIVSINTNKLEPDTLKHDYSNQFMVFDEEMLQRKGLVEYIKYHEHTIPDYKSDRKDAIPNEQFKRIYTLKYLPEIVVILLNRYTKRTRGLDLPSTFDIATSRFKGYLRYKKVAEIDHSGSLNGGHYVSKVLRGSKEYLCNDSNYVTCGMGTSTRTYITIYELRDKIMA